MELMVFGIFAALAVAGAILVIAARNPVHSALALLGTAGGVAALFVLLEAHFLAPVQVLVYAGVTLVIIRRDLADRVPEGVPAMLKYATHIGENSCFNTPPTFSIYMIGLVTRWMKEQGGLRMIEKINEVKSESLYECIDNSKFYSGTAEPGDRSKMNVTFRMPGEDLERVFVKQAEENGLIGLKGHRSIGGIRASIYNAMPLAGVSALIDFMDEFERVNG